MSRNSFYPTISQIYNFQVGHKKEEKTVAAEVPPILEKDIKKHNSEFFEMKTESKLKIPAITENSNLTHPDVFGPHNWFVFHNTATNYPKIASPFYAERMKNFILAIPLTLPCQKCKEDATAYIDSFKNQLDVIVSGREHLFNFFVDFHNYVNTKQGKRSYTYDEIKKLYNYKND